jgi:hypothetical protein
VAAALNRLKKLANVKFGPSAKRNDFYEYLAEVYRWALIWEEADKIDKLRSYVATELGRENPRENADVFYLVIQATCPKSTKMNSKYAIALANAQLAGVPGEGFETFLEEIGGPTTLCTREGLSVFAKIRKAKESRRR